MFTILSIDWGEKFCGLAFGDLKSGLILPSNSENLTKNIWEILAKEIQKRKITTIILGLPTNFKLKEIANSKTIENFAIKIEAKFNIKPILVNERGSTQKAKLHNQLPKFQLDNLSASQILENYFVGLK